MRGDRPIRQKANTGRAAFTPHARGSTVSYIGKNRSQGVYPACAGIDLQREPRAQQGAGLPRMRGDRPLYNLNLRSSIRFTPHARGSTVAARPSMGKTAVYPACAGIDPIRRRPDEWPVGLPRMRGDRPPYWTEEEVQLMFTPHARGSTYQQGVPSVPLCVYPACAGIDPCT